jgi:hypothetical protein
MTFSQAINSCLSSYQDPTKYKDQIVNIHSDVVNTILNQLATSECTVLFTGTNVTGTPLSKPFKVTFTVIPAVGSKVASLQEWLSLLENLIATNIFVSGTFESVLVVPKLQLIKPTITVNQSSMNDYNSAWNTLTNSIVSAFEKLVSTAAATVTQGEYTGTVTITSIKYSNGY